MRFRVSHLLAAMLLVSVASVLFADKWSENVLTVFILIAGGGLAGLACGWVIGNKAASNQAAAAPVVVLSVTNALAWGLHRWAMWGIKFNSYDVEFVPILNVMLQLDNAYVFDGIALLIMGAVLWFGARKDTRRVCAVGAFMIFFWLLIFSLGYLSVGFSLFHDMGLS